IIDLGCRQGRRKANKKTVSALQSSKTATLAPPRLVEITGHAAIMSAAGKSKIRAPSKKRGRLKKSTCAFRCRTHQKPRHTGQTRLKYWAAFDRYAYGPNCESALRL